MTARQPDILLSTINVSYIHAAFGLRYLYANLDELQPRAEICEFTSHLRPADIVEKILQFKPVIIGFGVYIWNVEHTTKVISLLKSVAPEITIVIGGPEVSYEYEPQAIFKLCDHLICGAADYGFAALCRLLIESTVVNGSEINKVFEFQEPALNQLKLPYEYYTDEDIKNRVIYVEASRGCPFKCEFCLSALDKTALPFDIDIFLQAMSALYDRGARNFKFVDRTFNLKIQTSLKIMRFFLQRLDEQLFLHFEIIPDRLPDALKETISRFPPGCLQFEMGVQSFNPQVQALISRRQDNQKTIENIQWLRNNSHAHIHADLIFALPGENLQSFAQGFNQLYALGAHDIQLGILKRLRGTPVIRHTDNFQMIFDQASPYSILATRDIDFCLIQRVGRFARYWELIANSGHFKESLKLILAEQAFEHFLIFSDWLYAFSGKTHQIALRKLFDYIYYGGRECFTIRKDELSHALMNDYHRAGLKGSPEFYKKLKK